MSNMSYCRFENTSRDLADCVSAMEEAITMEDLDMSSYERDAMNHMEDLCRRFLNQYEVLLQTDPIGDDETAE